MPREWRWRGNDGSSAGRTEQLRRWRGTRRGRRRTLVMAGGGGAANCSVGRDLGAPQPEDEAGACLGGGRARSGMVEVGVEQGNRPVAGLDGSRRGAVLARGSDDDGGPESGRQPGSAVAGARWEEGIEERARGSSTGGDGGWTRGSGGSVRELGLKQGSRMGFWWLVAAGPEWPAGLSSLSLTLLLLFPKTENMKEEKGKKGSVRDRICAGG